MTRMEKSSNFDLWMGIPEVPVGMNLWKSVVLIV